MVDAGYKSACFETLIQNWLTKLLRGPQVLKANNSGQYKYYYPSPRVHFVASNHKFKID